MYGGKSTKKFLKIRKTFFKIKKQYKKIPG